MEKVCVWVQMKRSMQDEGGYYFHTASHKSRPLKPILQIHIRIIHQRVANKKRTLHDVVEFGHPRLHAQINRLFTKVDNNTTKNTRIDLTYPSDTTKASQKHKNTHLVLNLQNLCSLSSLRLFKCSLKTGNHIPW